MNLEFSELLIEALKLIRDCIYHCTIGKEGYNYSDIERLEEIIEELREEM